MIKVQNEAMKYFNPCRLTECFSDDNDEILVISIKGLIRLKGAGRIIWNMADGKHTIYEIAEEVIHETSYEDFEIVYINCIKLMLQLNNKELLIMNWNPLFKRRLEQYAE